MEDPAIAQSRLGPSALKDTKSAARDEGSGWFAVDFKDPEQLRELTCALARADFNLELSLPPDRLCPIIPGRLDYCLYVVDVLKASIQLNHEGAGVLVVDVGTGSSAIYPLLLSRLLPSAKFIATEVDEASYHSASRNVLQNGLEKTVTLHKTVPSNPEIIPVSLISQNAKHKISITMCNPPFYSSSQQIEALRAKKHTPPEGICTGSEVEMVCSGGEEGFIINMIRDSLLIRSQTRWFTSLIGKYTTLPTVVKFFKSLGGNNYAISELVQGRTRRWVIGWSWQHHRLPDGIARSVGPPEPRLKDILQFLPSPNHLEYYIPSQLFAHNDQQSLIDRITSTLQLAEQSVFERDAPGYICAWKVTLNQKNWTRNERRKRKFRTLEASELKVEHVPEEFQVDLKRNQSAKSSEAPEPILIVKLTVHQCESNSSPDKNINSKHRLLSKSSSSTSVPITEKKDMKISIDFLFGSDPSLFQSFWNHVLMKIRNNPG